MDHIDFKKKSANSYEQLFMTMRQLKLGHARRTSRRSVAWR